MRDGFDRAIFMMIVTVGVLLVVVLRLNSQEQKAAPLVMEARPVWPAPICDTLSAPGDTLLVTLCAARKAR